MSLIAHKDFQNEAGQLKIMKTIHQLERRIYALEQRLDALEHKEAALEHEFEGPETY